MKRIIAFLLVALMLGSIGCFAPKNEDEKPSPNPSSDIVTVTLSPAPTAAPSPTPAPQVFVMGDDGDFIDNLAEKCGAVAVQTVENTNGGRLIVVLQGSFATIEQAEALASMGAQVVLCSAEQVNAENAIVIPFEAGEHSEELLDALLSFPPHDTPVRLLGLFSSDMSGLKTIWNKRVEEGKIFSKGVHYDSDAEESSEVWIGRMLEKYVEGMFDGIICETREQAALVAAALEGAARKDRLEVFTLSWSGPLSPFVLGYVGPDWVSASNSAAAVVTAILTDAPVENPSPFTDKVVIGE